MAAVADGLSRYRRQGVAGDLGQVRALGPGLGIAGVTDTRRAICRSAPPVPTTPFGGREAGLLVRWAVLDRNTAEEDLRKAL